MPYEAGFPLVQVTGEGCVEGARLGLRFVNLREAAASSAGSIESLVKLGEAGEEHVACSKIQDRTSSVSPTHSPHYLEHPALIGVTHTVAEMLSGPAALPAALPASDILASAPPAWPLPQPASARPRPHRPG